jgi:hypothetical protein
MLTPWGKKILCVSFPSAAFGTRRSGRAIPLVMFASLQSLFGKSKQHSMPSENK